MKIITSSWWIFLQFMHRDFYVRKKRLLDNIINYAIIYPIIFGAETAYLQTNVYFGGGDSTRNTIFFAGTIIFLMIIFTYNQNVDLLFDFENKRFINYQISIFNPFLVMLERILFSGIYAFCMLLPFYPITSLLFRSYIDFSHTIWLKALSIIFLGSFCLSAYFVLAACLLESPNLRSLWARANRPLMLLGGVWVPWYVVNQYSPLFSYCLYLNPCIYISEGIKGSITGNPLFLPFWLCFSMLIAFTTILTLAAWRAFKRRTDCL
jgi:ABC-type multidrug transport system permease subunit